jgi:catechol 2,3-dioxygenase-like lactoylglutathione lyase family enzyme
MTGMGSSWHHVVVDASDPARLARWWAGVLGYTVVYEDREETDIAPAPGAFPQLVFVPVPEAKKVKNRLHLDLNPDDQTAEVERLVDMGARRVDVGQPDPVPWVVLADPEGNEFCVLTAR